MNSTSNVPAQSAQAISREWKRLKESQRAIRARDAAESLGVSEAQLVHAAALDPKSHPELTVKPLGGEPAEVFARISDLGYVMALTRNSAVVSERYGHYGEIGFHGKRALVHTDDMDLRVDFHHWHYSFATTMQRASGPLHGLQFFDRDGTAVHKVFVTDRSNMDAYHNLVSSNAMPNIPEGLEILPAEPPPELRGETAVDAELLRDRWNAITDTHQFAAMLNRLGVQRLAALRVVGPELAKRVSSTAWKTLLENSRDTRLPLMMFVRSPGCTQIYTGYPGNLRGHNEYFNVFDPEFHLHIREKLLTEAWIVRKPTDHGTVTSLEVYDAAGELALQFFGVRDEQRRDRENWRSMVEALPEDSDW
ncbi:MAG: hemin-degrading factor [Spirochaetales bacterium]